MARAKIHLFGSAFLLPLLLPAQTTQTTQTADGIAFFEKNARPLLAANSYACHSSQAAQPMAGLLLDTRAGMLRGGKSGVPAIVAGKPGESLRLAAGRCRNQDLR